MALGISEPAVLLLGGTGARLTPVTQFGNKHFLPVYDRSLAENAAAWLSGCGFTSVVAVVPRDLGASISRAVYETLSAYLDTTLAFQRNPDGTCDAVECAIELGLQGDVTVLFGDNVFGGPIPRTSFERLAIGYSMRCFAAPVDADLSQFAAIRLDNEHLHVVTKPHPFDKGMAMVGLFVLCVDEFSERMSKPRRAELEMDLSYLAKEFSDVGALEIRKLGVDWQDACYSFEALWRASELVRRSSENGSNNRLRDYS